MGKIFSVDPDKLAEAGQKLQTLSDTYTEIYTQLLQEASTMGTAWEGPDNLAYVEQINGFCDELKSMATKLSTDGQTLKQQSSNYVSRRENNITLSKKLPN